MTSSQKNGTRSLILGLTLGTSLLGSSLSGCGAAPSAAPEYAPASAPAPIAAPREPGLVRLESQSPMITLRVVYDAGSNEDPDGQEGATALAARWMLEGGAGELDYEALTQRLYPMAAELAVRTDRDTTVFVGRVHRDHLEDFYAIFRDVFLRPRFGEEDFARLRAQAQTELTSGLRGSNDEAFGQELLQNMLYEGTGYAHPSVGTELGLEALTPALVRAQAAAVFCGGRATVGVAGGVDAAFAERVRADLRERFDDTCRATATAPDAPTPRSPRVWIVDKPGARAVAVSAGVTIDTTRSDPRDYAVLTLAAAYLGQHRTFAGLLMQRLRGERGLNYGDYAYAEHFEQEGHGRFPLPNIARREQYFSIWLRPLSPDQAHFALRAAVRYVRRFVSNGISDEEFAHIRDFASRYLALYLQTESRRLGFALDDAYYGADRAWLASLRAEWEAMTAAQFNARVRELLDVDDLQIALIAPNASALAEAISSEAPSPIEYRAEPSAEILEEDREIVRYRLGIDRAEIRIIPVAETFHD